MLHYYSKLQTWVNLQEAENLVRAKQQRASLTVTAAAATDPTGPLPMLADSATILRVKLCVKALSSPAVLVLLAGSTLAVSWPRASSWQT